MSSEKDRKHSKKKKKRREIDSLDTEEHRSEVERMKKWAHENGKKKNKDRPDVDDADAPDSKRRRTRSMDAAEEKEIAAETEVSLTPDEWRKEHNITVRAHGNCPPDLVRTPPFLQFKQAPFHERIQQSFARAGFSTPTPIQSQSWPIALQNKDMICVAKTGSGKTCGFLLPAFQQHLLKGNHRQGFAKPVLLVLAPTRELSVQIQEETNRFGRPLGIRSVCCYGGSSKGPQIGAFERGVECVIATPGRLNDLIEMRKADLSAIEFLVLDEGTFLFFLANVKE